MVISSMISHLKVEAEQISYGPTEYLSEANQTPIYENQWKNGFLKICIEKSGIESGEHRNIPVGTVCGYLELNGALDGELIQIIYDALEEYNFVQVMLLVNVDEPDNIVTYYQIPLENFKLKFEHSATKLRVSVVSNPVALINKSQVSYQNKDVLQSIRIFNQYIENIKDILLKFAYSEF